MHAQVTKFFSNEMRVHVSIVSLLVRHSFELCHNVCNRQGNEDFRYLFISADNQLHTVAKMLSNLKNYC